MPTVILHVGTEKTGSSTIQTVLANNAEPLADAGFRYVTVGSDRGVRAKAVVGWKDRSDPAWTELEAEVARLGRDVANVVISNERLWQQKPAVLHRLASIFRGYDVRVLVYLREQSEFVQSLTLQNQKNAERAYDFRTDSRHLARARQLDYLEACRRLESIFGAGSVTARLFDRSALVDGDIVTDFLTAIGLPDPMRFGRDGVDANPSLTAELADILRQKTVDLAESTSYGDLLDAALRLSAAGHGSKYFLTEDQVAKLRASFVGSNAACAQRYLVNADAFPERQTWPDVQAQPTGDAELEALLLDLVERSPTAVTRWAGGRGMGKRLFSEGWQIEGGELGSVVARPVSDRCSVRFRMPIRLEARFGRSFGVAVRTLGDAPLGAAVSVNGIDTGTTILPGTIPVPGEAWNQLAEFELEVRPHDVAGGDCPPVIGLELVPVAPAEPPPGSLRQPGNAPHDTNSVSRAGAGAGVEAALE